MVRTSLALILAIVFALSLCIGCEGPEGPQGPTGTTGPQGPAGAGTRTVYSGTASGVFYNVPVPELTLADMPMISVYVRIVGKGRGGSKLQGYWVELTYYDGVNWYDAYLSEGSVQLVGCDGIEYRIVVVE